MFTETRNLSLAEIVTRMPAAAPVLERHHLDYCCKGKKTLGEACQQEPEKLKKVEQELFELASANTGGRIDFRKMGPEELIDYILARHHSYVKNAIPGIIAHLEKVNLKHGLRHPEIGRVLALFIELSRELTAHMKKEEMVLFPRIRKTVSLKRENLLESSADREILLAPVRAMETEHTIAGALMEEIQKTTDDFSPPSDACMTFRISYHELREFAADLHTHVHLENNVLFPKALKLFGQ